ncbi:hypothetical protein HU200_028714 [Digitaria exilis]|uniref:Disease resistance N-terminal domain-containing protein n=1 Tax=Digitaria exilis TaxID=1010633 RepID=A0A835ESM4_9POAL|nr:hypothetical protein HU200_028714 [Digitaria exilis]
MADLALGYSKTALDFVVNKVQTAIKEEEEQWQTVQRVLVFITGEFEMMQSFLNTADGERLKSLVVRTWVQQVRDLSYDVEDSIEFVLDLDMGNRPWWLWLLPSWMKAAPEAPVDEAVTEITELKARVVDVSNRNTRYNLVTDSSSGSNKPAAFRSGIHVNTHDFLGIDKCLGSAMSLRVICVLSETAGDLGAKLFVRRLYEDYGCPDYSICAWVKLMHPFNPDEFIRSLVAQFLRSSCEAQDEKKILGEQVLRKMGNIQLIDEFVQQVDSHDYFIVLEGVSSMEEWDAIKTYLPDRMNQSRIIKFDDI